MTDSELIREYVAQRSEDAFRQLVERHVGVVYGVALRNVAGDSHLAQDVVQKIFVSLARKSASLQERADLTGWLYTAARLEAIRTVRDEARRRKRETEAESMTTPPSSPTENAAAWELLGPVLDGAIAELGEHDREAVLLRYFARKSFIEVGTIAGLSDEAARKRVQRALGKLRQHLLRRGIVSSEAALVLALETHACETAPPALLSAVVSHVWVEASSISLAHAGILMGTNKIIGGIAGALCALAVGIAVHDVRSLNAASQELSQALAENAAAVGHLGDLNAQLAKVRSDSASAAGPKSALPGALDPIRPYLTNSTYRSLSRSASQARWHLEFQRFYRSQGLTPEQIARFEEIMVRNDDENLDAIVAKDQGANTQAIYRRTADEFKSALQDLLGPGGMEKVEDYIRTTPVHNFVDTLATKMLPGSDSLTLDQADRVAAIALGNDAAYRDGKSLDPRGADVDWTAVWGPAAQVLTPAQLDTLQTMVEVSSLDKLVQDRAKALAAQQK